MQPTKRPFAVTCLIGLVLTLSGLQTIKLWAVISSWGYLRSLPLSIPPVYLGVSATFWLAVCATLAWNLWRAKNSARRATFWAAIAFAAIYWLDRLFLQANGPQRSNLLFDLVLSLVLLLSVIGILALPKVRAYFGEGNE